jgi:hypothetical protein
MEKFALEGILFPNVQEQFLNLANDLANDQVEGRIRLSRVLAKSNNH